MADSLAPLIRNYVQTYKPMVYFAEGKPNEKYTASSLETIYGGG